jgi:hypothetical protein
MHPPPDDRVPPHNGFSPSGRALPLPVILLWMSAGMVRAQDLEPDEELIRRQLDDVLAQPEFSRLRVEPPPSADTSGWLDRFSDWLLNLFPDWKLNLGQSGVFDFLRMVPSIIGVILVAAIILLIIRLFNNWRSRRIDAERNLSSLGESVGSTPPGEIPADEYLRRAQLAAANGIYSEAIAQLLLGTLSTTERHGLIRFRKGLTYRDYRRALRRIRTAQEAFQQLCGIYLPVGFGRRQASRDQFESSLENYHQCVRAVETAQSPDTAPTISNSPTDDSPTVPASS